MQCIHTTLQEPLIQTLQWYPIPVANHDPEVRPLLNTALTYSTQQPHPLPLTNVATVLKSAISTRFVFPLAVLFPGEPPAVCSVRLAPSSKLTHSVTYSNFKVTTCFTYLLWIILPSLLWRLSLIVGSSHKTTIQTNA